MLTTLAIASYRSLRNLIIPLQRMNVITGPNGTGKSNIYRGLRLLADVAQGRVVSSIAREGGLQSTLWAGPETISRAVRAGEFPLEGTRRKQAVSLRLGFASEEYGYAIDLGLPKQPTKSAFMLDPQIKRECIWHGEQLRPSTLLVDRDGSLIRIRDEDGNWTHVIDRLSPFDSMMTHVADPRSAPEILFLREFIRSWRFYDHFRTDLESAVRLPQVGTWTPALGDDGSDLASAIQTLRELGNGELLDAAVEDAFPGCGLEIQTGSGRFEVQMSQKGLLRPLSGSELSDGTLRYLLWVAALLTPRPPSLVVLNEPETSLHPDLLGPLARLVATASEQTQIIAVTHSGDLIASFAKHPDCHFIRLSKDFGETVIERQQPIGSPAWKWPVR